MNLKLVQLIAETRWQETQQQQPDGRWVNYDYDWMLKPGAMQKIARYADSVGPDYHMLLSGDTGKITISPLVKEAHASGMVVHPYTVRADRLPKYASDVNALYALLYRQADVDGLFTDFPDKAVAFLHNVQPVTQAPSPR
ncbi:hypothetical protein DZS_28070 [Dickeya ananatis]